MTFSPILLPLAQAAVATPLPDPDSGGDLFLRGLNLTNLVLLYAGLALLVYLTLVFVGRVAKKRFGIPLGWAYQLFAISMALFLPSLHHNKILDAADSHIDAATIITLTFVILSVTRHFLIGTTNPEGVQTKAVPKFLYQLASIVTVLVVSAFILQAIYGQQVPGLLAGAGIIGIVLGLALQDTLGNIFSGIAIYFGGQFKAGDWLKVGEQHAEITELNWRSTRLRTTDNIYLDIPNSNIAKETVFNFTHPTDLHAMRLTIGLDYDSPPSKVERVLIESALTVKGVLQTPPPSVHLTDFAASSITYELKFWMTDHAKHDDIMSAIRTTLWYALRRNHISIPYPIQMEMSIPVPEKQDRKDLVRVALSKMFFAECLTTRQMDQMIESVHVHEFGCGEPIIRQGNADTAMYILMGGQAEVIVDINGSKRTVATLSAGDCIGEMSLLTGEKRSATVIACCDTIAVEIEKETLAPVIASSPDLVESLSDLLARRRMQNEGILAQMNANQLAERQEDYRSNFLNKVRSFFSL